MLFGILSDSSIAGIREVWGAVNRLGPYILIQEFNFSGFRFTKKVGETIRHNLDRTLKK